MPLPWLPPFSPSTCVTQSRAQGPPTLGIDTYSKAASTAHHGGGCVGGGVRISILGPVISPFTPFKEKFLWGGENGDVITRQWLSKCITSA